MSKQFDKTAYRASLRELAQAVETAASMEVLNPAYDKLLLSESTPFLHIAEALALTPQEAAVLVCCTVLAQTTGEIPSGQWLAQRCLELGFSPELPLNAVFSAKGRALLALLTDYLWFGELSLPTGFSMAPIHEDAVNVHPAHLLEQMGCFLRECREQDLPSLLVLTGGAGVGKRFLLQELAKTEGFSLLYIDAALTGAETAVTAEGLCRLLDAMACVNNYTDAGKDLLEALLNRFSLVLVTAKKLSCPTFVERLFLREVPPLERAGRRILMEELFHQVPAAALDRAAELSRRTAGQLVAAAARFRGECGSQPEETPEKLFLEALGQENAPALRQKAQLLKSGAHLSDLVLPPVQKEQLAQLCSFAKVRRRVWEDWGFGAKLPYGRGLSALFYGSSGTGKTMAATVVANELGLDLYRVDISQLMSKYVGETQKNLGAVFDAAAECDCILFFDEADALFSRRTESGDAQDRYANAEIAYLLQRTESHDGVILLATNLLQNFDEAFRRRIGYMLHFPQPDIGLREKLWRQAFPEKAPTVPLEFGLLAQELELSGASIKSAAVHAACMAAVAEEPIDMQMVASAARLEYQKLGRAFPQKLGMLYPENAM